MTREELDHEANVFAANLLVPTAFLVRDLEGKAIDFADDAFVASLAKKYGVSVTLMLMRIRDVQAKTLRGRR